MSFKKFEDFYDKIDSLVEKKRYKWTLNAVPSVDFDDVKIIILTHIFNKWHLYDQKRPIEGWVATIVNNQFINILRNMYLSTSRPCNRCPANVGLRQCTIYGEQCVKCPLFAKWQKSKAHAHNAKLPLSLENHLLEAHNKPSDSFDLDKNIEMFHKKMKEVLKPKEWEVYNYLYIENMDEEKVAEKMGLKTSEKHRTCGYKRISKLKSLIITQAKKVIKNGF